VNQSRLKTLLQYAPESGEFIWLKPTSKAVRAGDKAGYRRDYVFIRIYGQLFRAHHLAWLYVYGKWPTMNVDHIDRDGCNNAISNLRLVTQSQNLFNTPLRPDNTSGHRGVNWTAKDSRWRAYINVNGRNIGLGYFKTKDEAISARKMAELKYEVAEYLPKKGGAYDVEPASPSAC